MIVYKVHPNIKLSSSNSLVVYKQPKHIRTDDNIIKYLEFSGEFPYPMTYHLDTVECSCGTDDNDKIIRSTRVE